jgi:hypothetical protein
MKMHKTLHKIDVYHDNDHQIGFFEYSELWGKWYLRTAHAGLDQADLKLLYKYAKKLNRRLLLGKIYKLLNI